jgi:hypothetical protein
MVDRSPTNSLRRLGGTGMPASLAGGGDAAGARAAGADILGPAR